MRSYLEFTEDLLAVVGPHLSPVHARSIDRYFDVGSYETIADSLISKAASAQIPLPKPLYDEVLERIDTGFGFPTRIASVLRNTCRDKLVADSSLYE